MKGKQIADNPLERKRLRKYAGGTSRTMVVLMFLVRGPGKSWNVLLKSVIKSRPVMQTPVSESTETAPRDSLFLFKQSAAVSALRGLTHQWQPQSDHTPTIKYSFIRSVLQSGTPLQKHVLFSLTYSTGDTNQQWHCHLWAMQYDSLVVQMSDYTVQY